jgi:hypothetical protein
MNARPSSRLYCRSSIPRRATVALVALAWIGGLTAASAQNPRPSSTITSGKAFLRGEISIGGNLAAVETKSFTCTPVQVIKSGDKIPAIYEIGEGKTKLWSVSTHPFQAGARQVAYPIAAVVPSSDGVGHGLFPAVLKAKTDIKAGETHLDSYLVEAKRAVRAGDFISMLFVMGDNTTSLLSLEAGSDGKPWFTAFKDDTKPGTRVSAIEAWRIAQQYVAQGGVCDKTLLPGPCDRTIQP